MTLQIHSVNKQVYFSSITINFSAIIWILKASFLKCVRFSGFFQSFNVPLQSFKRICNSNPKSLGIMFQLLFKFMCRIFLITTFISSS